MGVCDIDTPPHAPRWKHLHSSALHSCYSKMHGTLPYQLFSTRSSLTSLVEPQFCAFMDVDVVRGTRRSPQSSRSHSTPWKCGASSTHSPWPGPGRPCTCASRARWISPTFTALPGSIWKHSKLLSTMNPRCSTPSGPSWMMTTCFVWREAGRDGWLRVVASLCICGSTREK